MEGEEEGEGEGEEGEGREEGGVGRTESFDGLTYGLIWLIPTVSTEVSEELKAKKGLVAKVLPSIYLASLASFFGIHTGQLPI